MDNVRERKSEGKKNCLIYLFKEEVVLYLIIWLMCETVREKSSQKQCEKKNIVLNYQNKMFYFLLKKLFYF